MLCFPNCKINLGLHITKKRDDGYHDIETVFYPVKPNIPGYGFNSLFCDVLEVVNSQETKLHLSGLNVAGNNGENLVLKAYYLLKERFPKSVNALDVYLHKVVHMGAGLGGGSADGAFMLRLLHDFFQLNLSQADLAEMALQLGSDCPFFIYNTPQFATGRGEQLTSLDIDLSPYSLQIICPGIHVSTSKAFALIRPKPAKFDLHLLSGLLVNQWKDYVTNDFESPVFELYPELASIKQALYDQGAIYASMSGSGSAVYGIFEKGEKAERTESAGSFYIE
jgi:4-diphosphocytidyl-2-C-methyl-D-erythritol kinase